MELTLPIHRLAAAVALAVASPLAGCIGPAAPVTANGLVIGAEQIPVELNLADPVDAVAFLAVPLSVTDLEKNVVDGAQVWIDVDATSPVDLAEEGSGLYAYDPASAAALHYQVGASYTLHAVVDGDEHSVTMEAPPPPIIEDVAGHTPGVERFYDLGGQGFDWAALVVLDQNGDVVHDSLPEDGAEVLLDLRESDGVDSVMVPAGVLAGSGRVYTVAVLAVRKADKTDFVGFGRFWSEFGMGSYAVAAVVTSP